MKEEVEKLNAKKKSLTSFNVSTTGPYFSSVLVWRSGIGEQDKDTLKDLRASVYYYENVADPKGDERRKEDIKRTGNQLKTVLMSIEKEIEGMLDVFMNQCRWKENIVLDIDAMIAQLKKESESLLDIPELQKLRVRTTSLNFTYDC